jgi:Fe-coproporphyrin III synthase
MKNKLHGSIIVTYRCNARCTMCDVWKAPSKPADEIALDVIEKLPDMFFTNVTGGEPFVRQDLPELIAAIRKKTKRIVISTNGYFTERIIDLFKAYPDLGIRISIEGQKEANDAIRGIPDGYERTLKTLYTLRDMGIKDIGFAMTVQDMNAKDLLPLYKMSEELGYEFATATVHNSHYFCKADNEVKDKDMVCAELDRLIEELLKTTRVKNWFRAYFNEGLKNFIRAQARFLPCEMGENGFFLDPYGDVLACNGMAEKMPMGNLKTQDWDEIWDSERAKEVRDAVKRCGRNCWMIGSAAPAIYAHPVKPILWVVKKKMRTLFK